MATKFDQLAAKMVADLIRDYKLKAFQAAAFPGNAGEESGGFTKLQEQNPRSGQGGLGFFQDTGPRRVAFEQWITDPRNAGKNYAAGDYAANYSFLVRELDGPENHVLTPLRAATTIEEATETVMKVFERPYLPTAHLEVRIDYARKALAAFQATGQNEDELRAQGRPGSAAQEVLSPLHAPGTTEIIPSAPKPQVDFNQIMAVIHRIVNDPLVREFAAPILASKGIILPPLSPQSVEPPKSTVVVTTPSRLDRPGVQLGATGFFAGLIAQLTGTVSPPQGLEHVMNLVNSPTVAGTLTTVLPIALAALSATGAPGAMAAGVLKIVGPLVMGAIDAKKKQQGQ